MTVYQQLKARVQLVRDYPTQTDIKLNRSEDVYELLKDEVATWDREKLISILLNSRNQVIAIEEVSVGTLSASIVHPREVFKSAILANASSIILVHNHPSSDSSPSEQDKKITHKIHLAAEIMDITLIDHLIISENEYSSWADEWTVQNRQDFALF